MQSLVDEGESKGMRDGGREWCWQHLKLPWESCATESYLHSHWPPLSQHSVCFCHSPSLSERISHPLLLQLHTASLLTPPSIPLLLCLLSYISTPPSFFTPLSPSFFSVTIIFFWVSFVSSRVKLPTVSSPILSCSLTANHLLPPSYSNLTHLQKKEEDKIQAKYANS